MEHPCGLFSLFQNTELCSRSKLVLVEATKIAFLRYTLCCNLFYKTQEGEWHYYAPYTAEKLEGVAGSHLLTHFPQHS